MNTLIKAAYKGVAAPPAGRNGNEVKQYLTFMFVGEMFSLNILRIKEIIWYANMTEVPMMPACIRGVINLRGAVVPVMDLSARFGKPCTPVTKSSCIVILEIGASTQSESQNMGVVVDAVQAVLEIPTNDIEPAPTFGDRIRSDFIEGIAKVNSKFVILLSIDQVLSTQEIAVMGQMGATYDVATLSESA